MQVTSLGYRTDLIFHKFNGQIIDRGDYLVIRTPKNPTFYWGNFLLFSPPPGEGDLQTWRDLFVQEIGTPPKTEHQVFGWDSPTGKQGEIQQFLEAGFRLNRSVVLTSSDMPNPPAPSHPVSIRPLKTDIEWEQALENQILCRGDEFEAKAYRKFKKQKMAQYQKMAASGKGDWYGAFIDRELVADLGLFHQEGVGRYQSVETHPDFRRRGIAGRMILETGRQSMAGNNLHTLVIIADEDSDPARLYTSLGFHPTEKQIGVEWWENMSNQQA